MNLYLLSQDKNRGYDTYDSAVVAAEDEESARLIRPGWWSAETWNGKTDTWDTWANAEDVTVELIGVAVLGTEEGVILASFNAG